MLGISKPYPGTDISTDYESPITVVYNEVAMHIIRGSQSLDILLYALKRNAPIDGIPSWVPDWTFSPDLSFGPMFRNRWSAGGNTCTDIEFLSQSEVLKVKACIISTINVLVLGQPIIGETTAMQQLSYLIRFAMSAPIIPTDHTEMKQGILEDFHEWLYPSTKLSFIHLTFRKMPNIVGQSKILSHYSTRYGNLSRHNCI
jgi:hypothetical protein